MKIEILSSRILETTRRTQKLEYELIINGTPYRLATGLTQTGRATWSWMALYRYGTKISEKITPWMPGPTYSEKVLRFLRNAIKQDYAE